MSSRGMKDCPNCKTEIGARAQLCSNCAYFYPEKKVRKRLLNERNKENEEIEKRRLDRQERKNNPVKKNEGPSMKGKKECPNCKTEIGARTKLCDCGYYFPEKAVRNDLLEQKKEKKEKTVYTTLGRGKKQCPDCEKIVGAILKTCECGFDFVAAKKKKTEEEEKIRVEKRQKREQRKADEEAQKEAKRAEKNAQREQPKKDIDPRVVELLDHFTDLVMEEARYFTPDEHAKRILKTIPPNRASWLVRNARRENCWKNVNWKMVEKGLRKKGKYIESGNFNEWEPGDKEMEEIEA